MMPLGLTEVEVIAMAERTSVEEAALAEGRKWDDTFEAIHPLALEVEARAQTPPPPPPPPLPPQPAALTSGAPMCRILQHGRVVRVFFLFRFSFCLSKFEIQIDKKVEKRKLNKFKNRIKNNFEQFSKSE
jgi:hypothetical protein